jgi:short-subunit dehydrogenase
MHVVITGASSGIGEALAREYLARGASVTLVARRASLLHAIAESAPGRTHVVARDLSEVEHANDFIEGAEAALGPIDVLINNAGASMVHRTVDTDWSQAETLLRLNLLTPFKLTVTLMPRMLARGSGCIVDVASTSALAPAPGFFFYNASKAGLAAASESLRVELRRGGVHVVTVYPGPVHTPMADANFSAFDPELARRMPTGDTRVLARLIAEAVEKKQPRVIYPRVYAFTRHLPALVRLLIDRVSPEIKTPRVQLAFAGSEEPTTTSPAN